MSFLKHENISRGSKIELGHLLLSYLHCVRKARKNLFMGHQQMRDIKENLGWNKEMYYSPSCKHFSQKRPSQPNWFHSSWQKSFLLSFIRLKIFPSEKGVESTSLTEIMLYLVKNLLIFYQQLKSVRSDPDLLVTELLEIS